MHGLMNVRRETCLVLNGIRALDQVTSSLVIMAPGLSRAMDQAVSRGIFTVQSRVQFQTIPCRMSVEQRNAGTVFSHSTPVSPVIIIPTELHTQLFTYHRRYIKAILLQTRTGS
jgi:hypothetical protein